MRLLHVPGDDVDTLDIGQCGGIRGVGDGHDQGCLTHGAHASHRATTLRTVGGIARIERTGRVVSVNVGRRTPRRQADVPSTAIDKQPVTRIEVRDPGPKHSGLGSGAVGDEIGDPRHHGGRLQAVYAYAVEDQRWWAEQIGRPSPQADSARTSRQRASS